MAVRKIIRMGHPVLRRRAQEVAAQDIGTEAMHRLLADMIDTLHDYGGIGLAAPQVGESMRLAIVHLPAESGGGADSATPTVCFNPIVEVLGSETAGFWEGCLSVPGLRGFVERPQHIRVTFTNPRGETECVVARGLLATVFQHEFDHLDGKLYIDRISDSTKLAFEEEYARYLQPAEAGG